MLDLLELVKIFKKTKILMPPFIQKRFAEQIKHLQSGRGDIADLYELETDLIAWQKTYEFMEKLDIPAILKKLKNHENNEH